MNSSTWWRFTLPFCKVFDYLAILLVFRGTIKIISLFLWESSQTNFVKMICLFCFGSPQGQSAGQCLAVTVLSKPDTSNLHFLPNDLKGGRKILLLVAVGSSTWIMCDWAQCQKYHSSGRWSLGGPTMMKAQTTIWKSKICINLNEINKEIKFVVAESRNTWLNFSYSRASK